MDEVQLRSMDFSKTAPAFKVGDTVMLTSGGHLMTVIGIDREGVVTCAWSFDEDIKCEDFPISALFKATKASR